MIHRANSFPLWLVSNILQHSQSGWQRGTLGPTPQLDLLCLAQAPQPAIEHLPSLRHPTDIAVFKIDAEISDGRTNFVHKLTTGMVGDGLAMVRVALIKHQTLLC
ncbi:MAG: hypothetical protein ACBR12_03035 [Microcoleus sp.]